MNKKALTLFLMSLCLTQLRTGNVMAFGMQPTATPFPAPISLAADTTLGGINSAYDITLNNHTLTYTPSAGPAAVFTGNFIGPGRIVHDGVGT